MTQQLPEGTVTILFTDVVGSTLLSNTRGDVAAQEIMRAQRDIVRQQLKEHSGHEVKGTGDGFMVAFQSARRAIGCAIGIQRAIEEQNIDRPADQRALVRIGVNSGEVIREDDDLFGTAVNAAARVASKAEGGQILVSETVKALVGSARDLKFTDRGRFRLKGFPERWRLFEVVWRKEAPANALTSLGEQTPFVGRTSEREELRGILKRAIGGRGTLVLIGGEAGVGKSRLVEEVATEARGLGMLALTGCCYEMTGAPPYIPFVEMLEEAGRLTSLEALRDALGESAPEVAKLVPELRRMLPDIQLPPELPPEQERRYVFNGVRDFFGRAGRAQPLLLIIEDLHWGDDSSLVLLFHIAQQLSDMRVLILATYRDLEVTAGSPLSKTLEELTRQRLARLLTVKRLPEAAVAAMLRTLGGREPPKPLLDVIFGETEGNPFFVEEVLKHLAEEGRLFDEQGNWCSVLDVGETNVPESLRLVIGRRLERLDEDVRRVLTAAAVIGRSFSFELLTALSELDTDALLDAVDGAERAQLLTSASDGPHVTFRLSHELIRQTLLAGVSAARRQRLHLRAAEAMEQTHNYARQEYAPDVAYHLAEAGATADPVKTAHFLTLAGDRALSVTAFEDALRQYESALSLHPTEDRRGRAELLYKRGLALRSLGRWDEALADWREALGIFEQLGDNEAVGRISCHIAQQLLWGARFLEALQISQRGLIRLPKRLSADRCRLLAMCGSTLSLAGYYTIGDAMVARALVQAETLGDKALLGETLAYKAIHHYVYMQYPETVEAGLRAADLLRSGGDLWLLTGLLSFVLAAFGFLGRVEEAEGVREEFQPLAMRLGHQTAPSTEGNPILDVMRTGNIDPFEAFSKQDLERARSLGLAWISNSYIFLGVVDFWRGRWHESLKNCREAAKVEPPGVISGNAAAFLFLVSAYVGDKSAALAVLREKSVTASTQLTRRQRLLLVLGTLRAATASGLGLAMLRNMMQGPRSAAMQRFPRRGHANTFGAWTVLLAAVEGLVVLGEEAEAAKFYPLVLEAMGTRTIFRGFDIRLLDTLAGIAAAAGGHWAKAEEHFQTALRRAEDIPHKLEQPDARRWYARMLIDRDGSGDREKARQLLTEAIEMYTKIGMPKHQEMAEALLGQLQSPR